MTQSFDKLVQDIRSRQIEGIDRLVCRMFDELRELAQERDNARAAREQALADARALTKDLETLIKERDKARTMARELTKDLETARVRLEESRAGGRVLAAENKRLREKRQAHELELARRWEADQRAIAKWAEEHSGELAQPDHADLVIYMGERLEELEDVISRSCSEMQAALTPIFETTPAADENRRGEPADEHYVRVSTDGNAWSTRVALEARSRSEIFTYATVDQGGGEVDLERYKADFLRRIADTELVPITEWEK